MKGHKTIALHPTWVGRLRTERPHALEVGNEIEIDFGDQKLEATVVKLLPRNRVKLLAADGRYYSAPGDILRPSAIQGLQAFARRYA